MTITRQPPVFVEPIKVVADILQKEMLLAKGQIMLAYQQYEIPKVPGLYVALDYLSSKPISANNTILPSPTGMDEIQSVTMRHIIQIDILSFNSEARTRKEEILMALSSVYSQAQQAANSLQIARLSSEFTNTASLEDTKILNRFTISIAVTAVHNKIKGTADYYDDFTTEFQTELSDEPTEADPVNVQTGATP